MPIHFWELTVFEDIGNTLGRYLKTYIDQIKLGLFTYSHLCMDIEIGKELLNKVILQRKGS